MQHSGTDEAGEQNPTVVLKFLEKVPILFEHFVENLHEQNQLAHECKRSVHNNIVSFLHDGCSHLFLILFLFYHPQFIREL